MIAPGKDGILIGKVGEITASILVSPREFAPVAPFGGVFPLRFGWKPVFAAFACAQPIAELDRIQTADVDRWVLIPRSGSTFDGMRAVELFVLGIGDQVTRYIKTTDRYMRR